MRGYAFLLLILLLSCDGVTPKNLRSAEFFNLDSLIDNQIAVLSSRQLPVTKIVVIDGQEEERIIVMDSSEWDEELSVMRDLDLNIPRFVGAFVNRVVSNGVRYEAKAEESVSVKYVEYLYDEGSNLQSIRGSLIDDKAKSIYSVLRDYELRFRDDVLYYYRISGYQKMVLKDTTWFEVKGLIKQ